MRGAAAPAAGSASPTAATALTPHTAEHSSGVAFFRGRPPKSRAASTEEALYYFRPVTAPPPSDAERGVFERCASKCLRMDGEQPGACWFFSTYRDRTCNIHTGLMAYTSSSV